MINKIIQILKLPKVTITIVDDDPSGEVKELFHYFNKRHPKYKLIRNKSIGAMLYPLPKSPEAYESLITGKNSVSYYTRRCKKMGYYTKEFKQADYLDEIYAINTSTDERQGQKMSDLYTRQVEAERPKKSVEYYGVFTKDNLLVGYVRLIKTKNIIIVSKLLGHKDYLNDNIMYLLLHDVTVKLVDAGKNMDTVQYFMYDTCFGGSTGLKLFKKRNCFNPYKVKWKYEQVN